MSGSLASRVQLPSGLKVRGRSKIVWLIEEAYVCYDPKSSLHQKLCYRLKSDENGTLILPRDKLHTKDWCMQGPNNEYVPLLQCLKAYERGEEEKKLQEKIPIKCPMCTSVFQSDLKRKYKRPFDEGLKCPKCEYVMLICFCKNEKCGFPLCENIYKCSECGKLVEDGVTEDELRKFKEKRCDHCDKAYAMTICGKCGIVRYCSVECQKAEWADHKNWCENAASKAEELGKIPCLAAVCEKVKVQTKGDDELRELLMGIKALDFYNTAIWSLEAQRKLLS
jgi:DNA-directed RNA polymerase subunit RPC12/RpoP